MVRPERFELPACCSGGNRSIQLSYGRTQPLYKPLSADCVGFNPGWQAARIPGAVQLGSRARPGEREILHFA
jgi:hypothetical protein